MDMAELLLAYFAILDCTSDEQLLEEMNQAREDSKDEMFMFNEKRGHD